MMRNFNVSPKTIIIASLFCSFAILSLKSIAFSSNDSLVTVPPNFSNLIATSFEADLPLNERILLQQEAEKLKNEAMGVDAGSPPINFIVPAY